MRSWGIGGRHDSGPADDGDVNGANPPNHSNGGDPGPQAPRIPGRITATLAGARHPLVAILLLMCFFIVLSGKPVDGILIFSVAFAISWDAGSQSRRRAAAQRGELAAGGQPADGPPGASEGGGSRFGNTHIGPDQVRSDGRTIAPEPASDCATATADRPDLVGPLGPADPAGPSGARPVAEGPDTDADEALQQPTWVLRRPSRQLVLLGLIAAIAYALIVGSFSRYSWPATFGIVVLGMFVVVIGWGGPLRHRRIPGKFSRTGTLIWSTLLVTCGLWELSALLMQPNFETSSWAHPTISTLTDPLLATPLGRSFALLGWVGLGLFLVLR